MKNNFLEMEGVKMDGFTEMKKDFQQLQSDILVHDVVSNSDIIVVRMYCNITARKSINFTYDIVVEKIVQENFKAIQARVQQFENECKKVALSAGIPVI